jgi:hypothetical protein
MTRNIQSPLDRIRGKVTFANVVVVITRPLGEHG